jgi:hypothetical protein
MGSCLRTFALLEIQLRTSFIQPTLRFTLFAGRPAREVHWLVPVSMVGSLIVSILFAVGHHLFYSSLGGTVPPQSMYRVAGLHISGQALYLAIGTTFAFLTRSCLTFAMALSYTQLAWYAVKRSSRHPTVSDIDNVTSALRNLLVILNIFAWIKWPLMLLVALLSWYGFCSVSARFSISHVYRLIPITTLIAPATLTVSQVSSLPEMRDVPSVAYTGANMFTVTAISSSSQYLQHGQYYTASYDYQGPSDAVNSLAITLSTQGVMLPVTPPAPNSNWNSIFFGPSIRCRNVSAGLRNAISLDIASYMNDSMFQHNLKVKSGMSYSALNPLYFAWTPSVPSDLSPDDPSFESYVRPLHRHESKKYDISYRGTRDTAPLYVAVIPSAIALIYTWKMGEFVATRWDRNTTLPQVIDEYIDPGLTLLQCDLHNATYDITYNFSAGVQNMESTISLLADEPLRVIDFAYGFTPKLNYEGFIAAPESGQELPAPADCQGLWNASSGTKTTCAFDANVLEKFSYQAVWDAFTQIVRGGLYVDVSTYQPSEVKDTTVANTVLARSTELEPIIELVRRGGNESIQQDLIERYSNAPGMYGIPGEVSTQPLSSMLEVLFRNITLSLASLSELQQVTHIAATLYVRVRANIERFSDPTSPRLTSLSRRSRSPRPRLCTSTPVPGSG